MILASLVGTACSGDTGGGQMMPGPTVDPVNPIDSNGNPIGPNPAVNPTTGMTAGPGGTPGGQMPPGATGPGPDSTAPGATGPGDTPPVPDVPDVPSTGACQNGVPVTSQIPRLTNLQYDAAVRDIFGVTAAGGSWSADFQADSNGELPSTQWAQYKTTAEQIAAAVMETSIGSELTTAAGDAAALRTSISNLGRKMFRRPLTEAEIDSFATLADVEPAGTPEEIAEAVVYTMLISPSFLMRTELDAPQVAVPGGSQMAYQLSDYEVASRLSFLIWNSVPDAELERAADAGELQTKEQVQAQATRMLGEEFREKITPVIIAAHRFYANIDESSSQSRWGKTPHDTALFPEYQEAQTAPLLEEMDRFFAEVGYDGQFEDLFLSNVAYVNQATAPIYGVQGNFGSELQRVELDPMERPGFLTRGAFLSSFAHERNTSPILRGVYILGLMGASTPSAPAGATETALPEGNYKTNREAVTALTSVQADCIGCHENVINPPGFVLENFSAIGTIQTTDPEYGGPIDTKVERVAFPSGAKPINNAYEMMSELATLRNAKEIYARKWVSYATGRESNDFDLCTANLIADKMDAGGYNLASVLADITQADSFRLRVAAE